jgi:UDP-N-acetylmuramate dehydrogenase
MMRRRTGTCFQFFLLPPSTFRLLTMLDLLAGLNIRLETDVPLGPRTWYGIGGPAKVLAHPSSVQQLSELAQRSHQRGIRTYVLGAGANLLIGDQGVQEGIVIQLDDPAFRQCRLAGNLVTVGAGYDLAKLVLDTAKAGLGGLECLAGIPASVGGALRMNAGGAFGDIGPAVARVQVMSDAGQVYYRDRDDLVFNYRKSNIVARYILEVELELAPDDPDEISRRVKEVFLYKKNSQPLADNSAGCAFKNPQPDEEHPDPKSAGWLIDQCGLKGHRIGSAAVSDRHANFIVADKGGKAGDVLALLDHVQQTVRARFGIDLEREVVVWP